MLPTDPACKLPTADATEVLSGPAWACPESRSKRTRDLADIRGSCMFAACPEANDCADGNGLACVVVSMSRRFSSDLTMPTSFATAIAVLW